MQLRLVESAASGDEQPTSGFMVFELPISHPMWPGLLEQQSAKVQLDQAASQAMVSEVWVGGGGLAARDREHAA